MCYVYVLKSEKDKKLYVGYATDVDNRVKAHNSGSCVSTKARRPLKLVYYEAYLSEKDARMREGKLKKFKNSYKELIKRIDSSIKGGGGFNSHSDLCSLASLVP